MKLNFIKAIFIILSSLALSCSNDSNNEYQPFHFTPELKQNLITNIESSSIDLQPIRRLADSMLNIDVEIPIVPGNWPHYYVDPDEGKRLITGKYLGNWKWEHYNQDRTKVYLSDTSEAKTNYDAVVVFTKVQHGYADALLALSLMHNASSDSNYLNKIEEILLAYSDVYTKIPLHNHSMKYDPKSVLGHGRIGSEASGESIWLCKVTQALDMVWGDISAEVKSKFEEGVLRPALENIKETTASEFLKIHNLTCWYLAAIGTSALLLEDSSSMNWVLSEQTYSLETMLNKGFTDEGFWYERAPSYHFYAITPLVYLADAAFNRGFGNYNSKLEKLIMSYTKLANPVSLEVPRYNDSRPTFLYGYKSFYAYLNSVSDDPLVEKLYAKLKNIKVENASDDPINSDVKNYIDEIIYFQDTPNSQGTLNTTSAIYPNSGYSVLSNLKKSKGQLLTIKHDAFSGDHENNWHMHEDQLSFTLFWDSLLIFEDPGHAEYGAPAQNGWYRKSLSHNTLTVDTKSQWKRLPSKSLQFSESDNYAVVSDDNNFEGVNYTRSFWLPNDSTMVIIDDISSEESHTYDIAMHPKGHLLNEVQQLDEFKIPQEGQGYEFLINPKTTKGLKSYNVTIQTSMGTVNVSYLSPQSSKIILATGYGPDYEEVPTIIARNRSKNHSSVWMVSLGGHNGENVKVDFSDSNITIESEDRVIVYNKNERRLELSR